MNQDQSKVSVSAWLSGALHKLQIWQGPLRTPDVQVGWVDDFFLLLSAAQCRHAEAN